MTKLEFDKKYVGEKLVVNCKTEELADEFLELANEFGYVWASGDNYKKCNNYRDFEDETCYLLREGMYGRCERFKEDGYEIVSYEGAKKIREVDELLIAVGKMKENNKKYYLVHINYNMYDKLRKEIGDKDTFNKRFKYMGIDFEVIKHREENPFWNIEMNNVIPNDEKKSVKGTTLHSVVNGVGVVSVVYVTASGVRVEVGKVDGKYNVSCDSALSETEILDIIGHAKRVIEYIDKVKEI